MDALKAELPNLKACVIFFSIRTTAAHHLLFEPRVLQSRNRTSFIQLETLETSLVKLINIFQECRPAKRKFVRFHDQNCAFAEVGPLVDVTSTAANVHAEAALSGENAAEMPNAGATSARSNIGERVLRLAYGSYRSSRFR